MKTLTLAEILPVIEADRFDVENWLARGLLTSDYERTVRGRARRYSKVNVLELALVSSLSSDRRIPLKTAAEIAEKVIGFHAAGNLPNIIIIRDFDPDKVSFAEDRTAVIEAMFGAKRVTFLDLARIAQEVEELF